MRKRSARAVRNASGAACRGVADRRGAPAGARSEARLKHYRNAAESVDVAAIINAGLALRDLVRALDRDEQTSHEREFVATHE